jgi:phosphohistidine swiveling domain-containing protein
VPRLRRRLADLARPATTVLAHGGDHDDHSTSARPAVVHSVRPHTHAPAPLVALSAGSGSVDRARVGAKAASLTWLAGRGVSVPAAVVVPADVADRVVAGDTLTTELLVGALRRWLDPDRHYAVRSSADGEDGSLRSYAGQLDTRLEVPAGEIMDAVRAVARPDRERLRTYAERAGVPEPTRFAVIVQEQVAPVAAGIAFSRNPLTGLDEVVVEAVPGLGDALASEGVTPDRWIRRWGAFTEAPAEPRVESALIERVAAETARLARAWGAPIDVEWAHDGTTTWFLQARPLTGLEGLHVYSNRISRDVLPGVIKPLVWSVNMPLVNAAWIELLEELVGPLPIRPEDLARSFGYRAYFDMTTLGAVFAALGMPRDSLELLLGLPKGPETPGFRPSGSVARHLPRMLRAVRRTMRRGRWTRAEVPELQRRYEALLAVDPATLDDDALLARVDEIRDLAARAAYANILVPLVMMGYERALGRQLRAAGLDPADADAAAGRPDRESWDPNAALDRLSRLVDGLPAEARADVAGRGWDAIGEREDLAELRVDVDGFLRRFGHLSESGNDFSLPTWREDPDHVVDLVLAHRARPASVSRLELESAVARVPRLRRPIVRLLWRRTGAFRVYREAVGTTWTRSYGLFRATFLAVGARLVALGALDRPDDVFFLALPEVRGMMAGEALQGEAAGGGLPGDPRSVVARRRAEVGDAADLVMPEVVYGDSFVPRRRDEAGVSALSGIPTARGSARGPARIVRGTADFGRVGEGDIIVIPFSDVAWTPLFARAAGAVAEAGGMLSHSSVVAREYGIPCIVSVAHACSVIPDGAMVVLDGSTGAVLIEDAPAP